MKYLAKSPSSISKNPSSYCPGCMHSTANKIISEVLDELGVTGKAIGVLPVGCAVNSAPYFTMDHIVAAHGRAPAVATGIKRCRPDCVVFTYQGDGDLASIGMCETIHAANRGENILVIFINNSIYGMTGGQMSPTTLVGQASTTGGSSRDPKINGYPIHMCELINQLKAPKYIARFALNSPANIQKAKAGIRHAFEIQMTRENGYCFIELLTNCPTNWKCTPIESLEFMKTMTIKEFPLGVLRDCGEEN